MIATADPARARGLALMFGWPRLRFTLIFSIAWGLLLGLGWKTGPLSPVLRCVTLGLIALIVFGVFEQWPRHLPRWLPRWVLQVIAVAISMPPTTALIYAFSTAPGAPAFWEVPERMQGFSTLCMSGLLLAPWAALGALVLQKEAFAHHQSLAFDLERSELARQAAEARLRLLQAQVAPHFLFNTLANVQALVDTGSPQAPTVLRSLIAYLRAAVPRLHEPATTLDQELRLVHAYLELMRMRMPDRLQFELRADPEALALQCPPMTLLTLVENAVRHGIDPSEQGGRIDVHVMRRGERCVVRVGDTGVGLGATGNGLGTGLATLRERLQLAFSGDATVRVSAQEPRGVWAEIEFPARGMQA